MRAPQRSLIGRRLGWPTMTTHKIDVTARIRAEEDDDADLSWLGDLSDRYTLGALPWPGPGDQQERRYGRKAWMVSQHWPPDDTCGVARMEQFGYAKADRNRLYDYHRGGWSMVGIMLEVTLKRQADGFALTFAASLYGIESGPGGEDLVGIARDLASELRYDVLQHVSGRAYDKAIDLAIEAFYMHQ